MPHQSKKRLLNDLYKEYLQARRERFLAWKQFCWHRACLWSYHAYRTMADNYKKRVARGRFPGKDFLNKFELVRDRMSQQARALPEFEKYKDKLKEENEANLVYMDAYVKEKKMGEWTTS